MKLQLYIADLLHNHNCVIVQDFGGFVTNYKSAVIDELRRKIHPPSKSVLFNPHLTNNDGLLGNYVAQLQRTDFTSATEFISGEVADWKKKLANGERIEIGEIGFLYVEKDVIQFEQSREANLLLQAFGLRSVDFINFKFSSKADKQVNVVEPVVVQYVQKEEIAVAKVEEATIKVEVVLEKVSVSDPIIVLDAKEKISQDEPIAEVTEVIPIKRNLVKTILKYTAAAAFVPILFYSYWIPMETDALETKTIQFSDFNPIHTQPVRTYERRDAHHDVESETDFQEWNELTENINASVYNLEFAEDFYIPILLNEAAQSDESADVIQNVQNSTVQSTQKGNYHVISGCFSVKENAENLVHSLQSDGYSASILDKSGGLHRVTSGSYSNRDQAEKGLEKIKNAGHSGWILKR